MPTYEVILTEVVVTTLHVVADNEEEAIESLGRATMITQKTTEPDLEYISVLPE